MAFYMSTWTQFVPSEDFITSQTLMFEVEGSAIGHMRKVSDETFRMAALAIRAKMCNLPDDFHLGAIRALMCWGIPASFYAHGVSDRALEAFREVLSGRPLAREFEGLAAVAIQTLRFNPDVNVQKILAGE